MDSYPPDPPKAPPADVENTGPSRVVLALVLTTFMILTAGIMIAGIGGWL